MDDTQGPPSETITAANDEASAEVAIDAVVMTFARLLGRQMAREQFYAAQAAANAPAEEAAAETEQAAENAAAETEEAAEDAAQATENAAEEAASETGEAVEETGDAVENATDEATSSN